MSTHMILATPEYFKAEIEARYVEPSRRHRRARSHSSLEIEERAHHLRTNEANRLRRFARAALAH